MRRDRGTSVARPSVLGNPFVIGADGDRAEVIAKYRAWFDDARRNDARVRAAVDRLASKAREGPVTLLCYCAPQACHADVIAEEIGRLLALETR